MFFFVCVVTFTASVVCLQTSKARAEARLEILRGAGINVDEWLSENLVNEDDDAVDSSTSGRLSPATSAHSNLSDRVRMCLL